VPDLAARLRDVEAGDRRALARLLTELENGDLGADALGPLFAAGHDAHLVGITGPPGSGKSTLVNALVKAWREEGRRVGVIAIDPSSPLTGGAIMGDRIRMMDHAGDPDVFVRSMASRGALGGLAAATWLAAAALDAAGYDPVIIETVGAGQAEVEIASLAETTVVVEVPEMGDEVQAIKAGLLEVADLIVVNKSDRPGADRAARQLKAMLSTAGGRAARPAPPVVQTTATSGEGVAALREMIDQHRAQRTDAQVRERAANLLRRAVASRAQLRAAGSDDWESAVAAVADRTEDPFAAADRLLG
jgi:LAO/AO transport system kinase